MEMIGSFKEEEYERLKETLLLGKNSPNQIWKIKCNEISRNTIIPSDDEIILYRIAENISAFLANEIRERKKGWVLCTKNGLGIRLDTNMSSFQFRAFRWECVYE